MSDQFARQNYEIKARLGDRKAVFDRAVLLATAPVQTIHQKDTYYNVPQGRLKIRVIDGRKVELISYVRPDRKEGRLSTYHIVPLDEEYPMTALLKAQFGVKAVVSKERTVVLAGDTRIHFDRVEGLGDFIELEVMLDGESPSGHGSERAGELTGRLGIDPRSMVAGSYADLLPYRR